MLDADGQPVTGVRVQGLRANGDFAFSLQQPTSEVAVDNLSAHGPRMLFIRQEEKKLVGLVLITPDQGPTLNVRLQPWASVRGKLVTAEDKPLSGMNVTPRPSKGPNEEKLVSGFVLQSSLTDGEGNFVCDGLLPGWAYTIGAWRPVGRSDSRDLLETELVLKAGEVKDLGIVKLPTGDK